MKLLRGIDWRIVLLFIFTGICMTGGAYLSKGPEIFAGVGGLRNFILIELIMLMAVIVAGARR